VLDVIGRLRELGHAVYLVGGCVRDMVRKVAPKDFDVATSAPSAGIQHGTVTVSGVAFSFPTEYLLEHGPLICAPWPSNSLGSCPSPSATPASPSSLRAAHGSRRGGR
jgi:hypothetical protein